MRRDKRKEIKFDKRLNETKQRQKRREKDIREKTS